MGFFRNGHYNRPLSSLSTAATDFKFRNTPGSYRYRGLPCTAGKWYVGGSFEDALGKGGGVLEWCYDREDAEGLRFIMGSDPQYSDLYVGYWLNSEDWICLGTLDNADLD